jgi:mRNA interferase MazF
VTRCEVYRIRLPATRRREQRGPHYRVIVQADQLLGLSTVIVAPTSRSATAATFRPEIEFAGESTRVLVEQLRAVDMERLDSLAGRVTPPEQRAIDEALALILDLSQPRAVCRPARDPPAAPPAWPGGATNPTGCGHFSERERRDSNPRPPA